MPSADQGPRLPGAPPRGLRARSRAALAHLARGGLMAHTRRVESEAGVPRSARRALGRGRLRLQHARLHRPGRARAAEGERRATCPSSSSPARSARTPRSRRCATAPATTCRRTTSRGWCRRCCTRSTRPRRGARAGQGRPRLVASKQRLHELAQHLQTSVELERAAIAREIHDDVGGSLTALKFDLAWIAAPLERARRCSRAGAARRSRR